MSHELQNISFLMVHDIMGAFRYMHLRSAMKRQNLNEFFKKFNAFRYLFFSIDYSFLSWFSYESTIRYDRNMEYHEKVMIL